MAPFPPACWMASDNKTWIVLLFFVYYRSYSKSWRPITAQTERYCFDTLCWPNCSTDTWEYQRNSKNPAHDDCHTQGGSKIDAVSFCDANKLNYEKLQLITTKHRHPSLLFTLQNAINIHDSASPANECWFTVTALLIWSVNALCSANYLCLLLVQCSACGNRP